MNKPAQIMQTGPVSTYTATDEEYDFEEMFLKSPLLAAIKPIRMPRSRVEIPVRDFVSVEGDAPSQFSHVELISTKLALPFEVPMAYLSGTDAELTAHVQREMYLANATDLEDLLVNGDEATMDVLLRTGNGILANLRGKAKEITLGYDSLEGFADFIRGDEYTLLHNHSFEIEHSYPKAIMVDTLDQNTAVFINLDNIYAGYQPNPQIRKVIGGPNDKETQYFSVHHRVGLTVRNPHKAIIVNLFQKD